MLALALSAMPAIASPIVFTAMGTVIDANGDAVPGASVTLMDETYRELGTTTTDANGNFGFTNAATDVTGIVKAQVTYVHDGITYRTNLQDSLWQDASSGVVRFNLNDTRLYNYPPSDHGFIIGVVDDGQNNPVWLNTTIFITNGTANLTATPSGQGTFCLNVPVGYYEIFAAQRWSDFAFVSETARINVSGAYNYLDSPQITLILNKKVNASAIPAIIESKATATPLASARAPLVTPVPSPTQATSGHTADQTAAGSPIKLPELCLAFILGLLMIAAGWALFWRKH